MGLKKWYTKEETAILNGESVRTVERKILAWKKVASKIEIDKYILTKGRGGKLYINKNLIDKDFKTTIEKKENKEENRKEPPKEKELIVSLKKEIESCKEEIEKNKREAKKESDTESKKANSELIKELRDRIESYKKEIEEKNKQILKLSEIQKGFELIRLGQEQNQQLLIQQGKINPDIPTSKKQNEPQIDRFTIILGALIVGASLILSILIAGR